MRKVFLLTGFNNWGKTRLIKDLFNKERFLKNKLHIYSGKDFFVLPNSNDDVGEITYKYDYHQRVKTLKNNGITPKYVFSAFCPTKEPNNDSSRIIKDLYASDQVYIIPIVYKWCLHAKLEIKDISNYYSSYSNISIHPLKSKKIGKPKLIELQNILAPLI